MVDKYKNIAQTNCIVKDKPDSRYIVAWRKHRLHSGRTRTRIFRQGQKRRKI